VVATDLSAPALSIAGENARAHQVDARVELRQGDLFAALTDDDGGFDLVVANPPYIREDELSVLAAELQHEPRLALTSGVEGLDVLARLCAEVDRYLSARGVVLFEVGAGQSGRVSQLMAANPKLTGVTTHRDLGGIERVVEACLRVTSTSV
jgi:HemK-like putative methylase